MTTPPFEPKSPLFPNGPSSLKTQNRSPAFKKFCADELPPLSAGIPLRNPRFLSKTTPSKLPPSNPSLFSEQVLDIDTIIEKTKEVNNRDLFEKILNENDTMSPFLKKKTPAMDYAKSETSLNNSHINNNTGTQQHQHIEKFFRPLNIHNNTNNGNINYNIRLGSINRFEFRKSLNPITTPIKITTNTNIINNNGSPFQMNIKKPQENVEKIPEKPLETEKIVEEVPLISSKTEEKIIELNHEPQVKDIKTEENPINNNQKSPGKTLKTATNSGCKCKKSRCLKLYCECFSTKNFCKDVCNCIDCANRDETNNQKERDRAIQSLLVKNPSAFVSSNENSLVFNGSHKKEEKGAKKGCNCKKSHCLKRYCECFEAKLKCDSSCKCEDCKNVEEDVKKTRKKPIEESEKPLKKKKV